MRRKQNLIALLLTMMTLALLPPLMTGCGNFDRGPKVQVHWAGKVTGIVKDQPVVYKDIQVGKVLVVKTTDTGTVARIKIFSKTARYVRENSDIHFQEPVDGKPAMLEVLAVNQDAPPVKDGGTLNGVTSALQHEINVITNDPGKTALTIIAGIVLLLVLIFIFKLFVKIWIIILAVGLGAAATPFLTPHILPYIPSIIPASIIKPELAAFIIVFVILFVIFSLILKSIRNMFSH